jgi:hypothetical protein
MRKLGKSSPETLFSEAKRYKTYGWSVIPLLGSLDLTRAKHPAIKWGRYQHTRPQREELEDWFLKQGFAGLGVVCGRVSNLVVLDFDDPEIASDFRRLHPQLTQTRVIQSGMRGLPHYYYHLPEQLKVYSRGVRGVDLRADGAYVVAPPTYVGDAHWQLIQEQSLHSLSADDLKTILRFLVGVSSESLENSLKPPCRLMQTLSDVYPGTSVSLVSDQKFEDKLEGSDSDRVTSVQKQVSTTRWISDDSQFDLVRMYRNRLSQGRNNALFRVSCLARNAGWSQQAVEKVMSNIHALQPDSNGQCESFRSRLAEAQRTIQSAFNQPMSEVNTLSEELADGAKDRVNREGVGNPTRPEQVGPIGLLNSVREKLLEQGFTGAARVLDGLYLVGLKAGAVFTERQVCELLQPYHIGRRSIVSALKLVLADGLRLFTQVTDPLHTTPKQAGAAINRKTAEKKCLMSPVANRVKTSGRPAINYILPDNADLARRLGVFLGSSDPLDPDDLATMTSYRRALHRELIRRRPGQYSRNWLARRLSVSKWTCRRYEAALKMIVQPIYSEESIRWTNLENLLPIEIENAIPGTFLEDAHGKRYAPLRSIAMRLLDQGQAVTVKRRAPNYYTYVSQEAVGNPTHLIISETRHAETNTIRHNTPWPIYGNHEHDLPSHIPVPDGINMRFEKAASRTELTQTRKPVGNPTPSLEQPQPSFWVCRNCLKTHISAIKPTICTRCDTGDWEQVERAVWQNQERLKVWWQTRWRERHPAAPRCATPLAQVRTRRKSDDSYRVAKYGSSKWNTTYEAAVLRIHQQVQGLSLNTARRLVNEYGETAVEKGVNRIMKRSNIQNPAGLLVTILRSEQKFYIQDQKTSTSKTKLKDSETWLKEMASSPYIEFLSNADELVRHASQ